MNKHIILGAGGAIGNVLNQELLAHGERVKLVSRRGSESDGVEAAAADLTNATAIANVVEEDAVVYLLAGLKYDRSVWRVQWPAIMKNVVAACQAKGARLIFFDNVYAYGRVEGAMTEETPINPCSKKGEIRAEIAEYLMTATRAGSLKALIARAADFYGPFAYQSSVPYIFVFSRLSKGKKAQALVSAVRRHSYTYTKDCGTALYRLARSEEAFNQVWHLPTATPALTSAEFIEIAAAKLGAQSGYSVMPKWMVRLGGIFNRQVGEVYEMLYQNEFDYIFDSTKFEKQFNLHPTPCERGIEETIKHLRDSGRL